MSASKDKTIQKFSGAIILLDRLGTKGIWKKNPEATLELWDTFKSGVEDIDKRLMKESEVAKKYGYSTEMITLSDTLLWLVRLAIKDEYSVLKLANASVSGMVNLGFAHDIFLRGCISIGEYYKAPVGTSIIGPAIDEAAQYYDSPEWIGVSLAPSANLVVRYQNDLEDFDFYKYDIPFDCGIEQSGIACDWIHRPITNTPDEISEKLRSLIKETSDVRVSLKYRNTLDFVEYVIQRKRSR